MIKHYTVALTVLWKNRIGTLKTYIFSCNNNCYQGHLYCSYVLAVDCPFNRCGWVSLRYLVDEGDELHDGGAPEVPTLAPYQIQQNLTHTQIL
jgi:hypothetical protein